MGRGWAPTEAMAVTSAARPPAPLGSLALNTITQAGPDSSASGSEGRVSMGVELVMARGNFTAESPTAISQLA
ncbi:hypothetical protein GCM10028813_13560 [Ramlibacter alkalitolerans]